MSRPAPEAPMVSRPLPSTAGTFRRQSVDPAAWFDRDALDRSRAYQRPLARMRVIRIAGSAAVLALLVLTHAGPRLSAGIPWWPLQVVVMVVLVELVLLVVNVPLDGWVDLRHDRRWGVSNQTATLFVVDNLKSFVLVTVLTSVVLVPLYGLVRWTPWWWLVGWLVVAAFSLAFGFLFPVVVAPIFNRFTPLDDAELVGRIQAVARAAGATISGVFVADESRRSTRDNAYVAGLGATRRVVLFDTILEHPPELLEQVVAHELGHWRRHHLRRQLPVLVGMQLIVFVALAGLSRWPGLFEWAGATGIADPSALPLLLLVVQPVSFLVGLVSAWVSRAFERQADLDALELLHRPDDVIEMLRRLHVKNLADLDPGRWRYLQLSHPPAAERMAFAANWSAAAG